MRQFEFCMKVQDYICGINHPAVQKLPPKTQREYVSPQNLQNLPAAGQA